VANFLLDYADGRGVNLTNMALPKHIYFAHGWHLASRGEPLVSNRIEAWQYGPVIRTVYDCFKAFEAAPIKVRATIIDWETGEIIEARGGFCRETAAFLRSTLDYYAGYGAFELSEITHAARAMGPGLECPRWEGPLKYGDIKQGYPRLFYRSCQIGQHSVAEQLLRPIMLM
jgi:uncharacterized phage-associated protein